MKVLLAVDGSDSSNRAVDHMIKLLGWYKAGVELHLLNVQPPISANAGSFVSRDAIAKYHQEEAMKDLQPAMRKLDAAGVKYRHHIGVGDPADTIAGYAGEQGCDQIVLGTRGMGSVSSLMLGSVATKVIHLSTVPVLLVK
jgi:nucleotide-binding universal stress UspA family protein